MSNLDVTYTFNQDSLRKLVRGIRNWGNDEVGNERLQQIGDMELAEMLIAAIRQWEGPGKYEILGPCDAVGSMELISFIDFNEFMVTLSNWSCTMKLRKVSDIENSYHEPTRGYDD